MALAVGPVQPFIAAARRTRDLWFGSQLLSTISLAAAKGLEGCSSEPGVTVDLIFPLSTADAAQGVSNKILAVLEGNLDPAEAAQRARRAAENSWTELCSAVLAKVEHQIRRELWDSQKQGVIEFYAAWCEIGEGDGGYAQARAEVEQLLSARKALRDFDPGRGHSGVPKSSLDGACESVCRFYGPDENRSSRIVGVQDGEHLDLVGIVKRVGRGDGSYSFPSVVQVAADPWIRGICARSAEGQKGLRDLMDAMGSSDLGFSRVDIRKYPMYDKFWMDASILFPTRFEEVVSEATAFTSSKEEQITRIGNALQSLRQGRSKDNSPEPYPYFACLSADGDRMGQHLSSLTTMEAHRKVSEQLAAFSKDVKENIVPHYRGVCVYAGGDDVLAFVPLDRCLGLARALHTAFGQHVGAGSATGSPCTLSVGIAIAHCREPLEDILTLTRKAEQDAKGNDRDGLAVCVETRSGGEPVTARSRWDEHPDHRIRRFANLFGQRVIPSGLPYELRQLMVSYRRWSDDTNLSAVDLIRSDVRRVLARKRSRSGAALPIQDREMWVEQIRSVDDVDTMCGQMIIAQHVAHAMRQSGELEEVV